ncbi:hypothetical protein NHQ30_007505 [Ciborinia camelliae]|nr:hypothetical protein NHQ30_007505 [Ciborinia camelliae]
MLGTGSFDSVANGDQRDRKDIRLYQDGTEEERREKKGLSNVSLDASATNIARFDMGVGEDPNNQADKSAQDSRSDLPRAQSLPIKGKPKKPSVFGSLRKMITRPRSEQDTAATGEHKYPTQSDVKQGLNSFNTIAGTVRGGKKTEGQEEAVSAPIDIPQKHHRSKESDAERHARNYIDDIGSSPYADEIHHAKRSSHGRTNSTGSHADARSDSKLSERWSRDTHSSGPQRLSLETEFSQSERESMGKIIAISDGGTVNITPNNVDDILAVLKGSLGTSLSSSPAHIPPRPGILYHSRSHDVLPIPVHSRSQGLDAADYIASLPHTQGFEERVERAQWTQENVGKTVPSAPSAPSPFQNTMDFVEPPRHTDMPKRNNSTRESPPRGAHLPKRSNTGAVPNPRHPLANEITRSNTLANTRQTQTRNRPTLPDIQEPIEEPIPGPRYSTIPVSPPQSPKFTSSKQRLQSPQIGNRKVTPVSKPETRTNLSVQNRASPAIDRSSIMTTVSLFTHSEEAMEGNIPVKASTKTSRQRMGSPNPNIQTRNNNIPEVPAIPRAYVEHTAVRRNIGRDETGGFSVEHIEQEQPGSVLRSRDEGASGEVPTYMYENPTHGTSGAALGMNSTAVSPLSPAEDYNRFGSPVSPLGESVDGRGWDDYGDGDSCLSSETYQEGTQQIYPSKALPPQFPSTSSPFYRPGAPILTPPSSFTQAQSPLPQRQHLQPHSPNQTSFHPTSTRTPFPIDPTIPITRPLQIRKKNRPPASVPAGTIDPREVQSQRQEEPREEEYRMADERMRARRDGRRDKGG